MSSLSAAQKAYRKGKKARNNAKKKGIVTSQKPKQKKNNTRNKSASASKPKQAYQPKQSYSKPKSSTTQPQKKITNTNATKQYNSYKKSSFAPKVTNTSSKTTSLQNAQTAFKKSQDARESLNNKGITSTQKPKNSGIISDFSKSKDYDAKKDLQKAYKTGRNKTYLGTDQEKVTVDLATKKQKQKQLKQQKKQYYKSDDWKATKEEIKKQNRKAWRDGLKEAGLTDDQIKEYMNSEEGKQSRRETYFETKESVQKKINKQIRHNVHETNTLESVNALTKGEFNKMVTASGMGKKAGNKFLGKKLAEKVGSKTAEAALRSKAATGVMQGMSRADVFSGGVGKYNKGAKTAIEQVKSSGAYNIGYGAGMATDLAMGGIATKGASAAEGIGKGASKLFGKGMTKAAAKEAVEYAPKQIAKTAEDLIAKGVPKNVAEEVAKEYAKISIKQGAKKFAKNRAGELVAETPVNVLDAAKMSMDSDGNLDKKAFRTWLAVNTGLTFGVGGAIEGIGAGMTRKMSNKAVELLGKKQAGTINEEEQRQLSKYVDKLKKKGDNNALSGDIANATMDNINKIDAKAKAAVTDNRIKSTFMPSRSRGQKMAKKIDDRLEQIKTEKASATDPEVVRRLNAEEAVAKEAKENLVTQVKEADNTLKTEAKEKPKPGTKSHRTNVETNKHVKNAVRGEEARTEIEKGLRDIADELGNGNKKTAKRKALELAQKHMKVEREYEDVYTDPERKVAAASARKNMRNIAIDISVLPGTKNHILENIGFDTASVGNRIKFRKNGGRSIEQAYHDLQEIMPEDFPEDIVTEEDMLRRMCEFVSEGADTYETRNLVSLSEEEIARQYTERANELLASADKISKAKPDADTIANTKTGDDTFVPTKYANSNGIDNYSEKEIQNLKRNDPDAIWVQGVDSFKKFIKEKVLPDNRLRRFYFGRVSADLQKDIQNSIGRDFTGWNIYIRNHDLVHAFDHHVSKKEILRGQINLTDKMVEKLPELFNKPDSIYIPKKQGKGGTIVSGKDKSGREIIHFEKRINGIIIGATGISNKQKSLVIDSIWIRKSPSNGSSKTSTVMSRTSDASAPNTTSKGSLEKGSISDNTVPQAGEKVNKSELTKAALDDAKAEAERLDKQGGMLYKQWKRAEKEGSELADDFKQAYENNQRAQVEAAENVKELEEKLSEQKYNEARYNPDGTKKKYASLDEDDITIKGEHKETIEGVVKESEEGFDDAPMKPPEKMDDEGVINAMTDQPRGLNYLYHKMVREVFVDNFDSLEHIANHLPSGARDKMLTQINELRRSQKTGRAIVAEKGRKIYADFGLTKRGGVTEARRTDFERYCFLKHELDRKNAGNNFTNLSRSDIEAQLEELEKKYATNIDKATGEILSGEEIKSEIKDFQKRIVEYFDDLLKREEEAGITSKEEAANFRKTYPNYVPTYKPSEFDEMLKRHTKDEIDVGKGIKAATGGEHELVPLYNQMQVKTNVVLKRTELNKTLNLLCMASGTTKEELDNILPFFKHMPDEEKPMALLDSQVFTQQKEGRNIAVMYHNGERVEIEIDKDVYDAIRRWSGEDRKNITIACLSWLSSNPALNMANAIFKKWITDYSLIFGLKNFKRDVATAVFYTKDLKGYVKNFPRAFAVCFTPDKLLSENMKMYKKALQVYKENGGIISQFVARDSASPTFFDTAGKFNPLKWVEDFNSTLETVPRMAEFLSVMDAKAIKAAGKEGDYAKAFEEALASQDSIADAMYRAKDVTLNFDRSGWFGAQLNRGLVPFFNPAIQGLDKLGRKLMRDNIKYGEDGKLLLTKNGNKDLSFFKDTTVGSFMKLGAALTGMVAFPTYAWNEMFGDYINGEKAGYEKQSDYNRYSNYLLPIGNGKFIKIPKARELTSMQASLDFVHDNMKYGSGSTWQKLFGDEAVRDLKSMAKISAEQIGPVSPFSDNLLSPIWRTYRNETWYGGKIESGNDLTLRENGERYKIWDEKTSAIAKYIGKKFNMSPKKVDNVIDSYTGIIYDFGIAQTSAKNDIKGRFEDEGCGSGIKTLLSTPFSQGFIIDSVFSNANKTDYYNYVDKRQDKLKKLKEGSDEYNAIKAEINKDKNAFSYTSSQYDELVSQIYLSKDLTPSQKNYYARKLKKDDNIIWNDRKDGDVVSSRDPMADAWNLKDEKGKRVMSTKTIINACSYTFQNGGNTIKDAYTSYKKNGGKSDGKFMEVTLSARDVNRVAGESLSSPRWEVIAYSNQLNHIKDSGKVLSSYIEKDSKRQHLMENARIYEEHGFTLKNYKTTRRTITQGAYDLGYDYVRDMRDGELTMVLANARTKAGAKHRDGSYQANDYYILNRMNSARCLDDKKNGHYSAKQIKDLCDKYKLEHNDDYSWDVEKVKNAIEKDYGNKSQEIKAAMFQVITGYTYKNPFGEIGDYSLDTDTGIYCEGGYYGYGRRRGRRRHGYGGYGGGRSSGTPFTPVINTAGKNAKITQPKFKSNLDDAYRKKLKKLREESRKKVI